MSPARGNSHTTELGCWKVARRGAGDGRLGSARRTRPITALPPRPVATVPTALLAPLMRLMIMAALALLAAAAASTVGDDNDTELVKQRLVAAMLPTPAGEPAAIKAAHTLAAALESNGTWPDIDYHEFRRAGWPMVAHLGRVRTMAAAWRGASNATGALLSETKLALDVWLRHDWQNPNWYDNEIGVPRAMGDIGLLLQPALSSAEATKIVEIMARADWKGSGTVAKPHWTGANLLDMLRIQIHRGAFVNRTSVVAEAFARSFAAVVPHHQNEESIMVDNSFHQHGPQLLAGAYGSVFTSDILDLAAISASTQFQMPVAAVTVFEGLVLDGQARMTRAGSWDWQVHGRGVSEGADAMEIGLDTSQMRTFGTKISATRATDWAEFAHRIDTDDASPGAALTGTRSFWDSDYLSHSQPGYLFTIHMFSARTIPAACVNEQGKLDRHLSDGATALYKTGHEYDGVFPCWNWTRPPGTTVATAAVAPSCGNARHTTVATFVGSSTDGTHAVAVQQLKGKQRDSSISATRPGDSMLLAISNESRWSGAMMDGDGDTKAAAAYNCSQAGGIGYEDICCLKSCGECSGTGCSQRKGGDRGCCSSGIKRRCSSTVGAPCRTSGGPPPPTPPHGDAEPDANANKTWLLFENAIVAVGEAEIPRAGGLVTSIEQTLLRGAVHVGDAHSGKELPPTGGELVIDLSSAGAWVLHGDVGYLLPQTPGAVAHVSNRNKTGAWSSLGVGSDAPVTEAVFDLFLVHEEEYLYVILPVNATASAMPAALATNAGYSLGSGGTGIAAALNPTEDVLLAAVWAQSAVVNLGCWSVQPSRTCAFCLQKWANGTLSASVSVPGADGGNLTLIIDDSSCERAASRTTTSPSQRREAASRASGVGHCKTGGAGGLELSFALPAGDFSGSSVSVAC
jgi:hypothetical protein